MHHLACVSFFSAGAWVTNRVKVWPHVLFGLILAAALLFGVENYRAAKTSAQPMLPVTFDHGDHTETNCINCHHDYNDDSGGGLCFSCHKQSPEIAADMELMFHNFCFECHVTKRQEGKDSGPQRECSGCHSLGEESDRLFR
jgi:hypothetical protein